MRPRLGTERKPAPVLAVLFLSLTTLLFAPEAQQDPFWRKAVAVAEANKDWVAGLAITRSEVLLKGKSEGTHESWQRSSLGENGEVIIQTTKVLEDGKDVTDEENRRSKNKSDKKKSAGGGSGNMFDPKVQDRLSLRAVGQNRVIAGSDCVGYDFELRNTNGSMTRGVAWLEKETGKPVEIENMTVEPLPDKFKRMAITTRYGSTPEGAWRVKEMIITGTVSVLFIKADTRTTRTFSEYWKKPQD